MLFENNKQFVEIIYREAVQEAIEQENVDIILNYNHDDNKMLARYNPSMGASSLKMEVREEGLWVESELPDTEHGKEVRVHLREGNLYGMSFVYYTKLNSTDVEWSRTEGGVLVRHIKHIRRINDVSVVRRPAFPTSSVQLYERAMKETEPELTKSQRDIIESKNLVEVLKLRTRLYN